MGLVVREHWALLGLIASSALGGCLSPAEGHCGNNGGDAACGGATPHCDLCTLEANGCMAQVPERMECRPVVEVAGTGSSSGSSSGGPGGSSSSTGSSECTAVDGLDEACADPTPYCAEGSCQGCGALDEGFCAALGADTPVCVAESGRCVGCTTASECSEPEPFCTVDLECSGCWKHEQCPDRACDLASGVCMPGPVVWVDSGGCPSAGIGTKTWPFCELASALELPDESLTIRLVAGPIYEERLSVGTPRTVAVIGEGGRPQLTSTTSVVKASNGARLYVAGVEVVGGDPAINCTTGELWLEDVRVTAGAPAGIVASNCDLHVHRSEILQREGNSIELRGNTDLELTSSVVGLGGGATVVAHAVYLRDNSNARVAYSTVAGNRGTESSSSIACESATSLELRNSIAVAAAGSSIDCPQLVATRNVADMALPGDSNLEVLGVPRGWFVDLVQGDFHLTDMAVTAIGDLGRWGSGDPYEDLDGQPRGPEESSSVVVGADAR